MRLSMVLTVGLMLPSSLLAEKSLPEVPKNCAEDIMLKGYCVEAKAPLFKGPIDLVFYVAIDKEYYPTRESIKDRYLDFNAWPQYAESSGKTSIRYSNSSEMPSELNSEGDEILRHYANYEIYSSVVGWVKQDDSHGGFQPRACCWVIP